jgi:hypothetical protein
VLGWLEETMTQLTFAQVDQLQKLTTAEKALKDFDPKCFDPLTSNMANQELQKAAGFIGMARLILTGQVEIKANENEKKTAGLKPLNAIIQVCDYCGKVDAYKGDNHRCIRSADL